jgi:hypothetical protein
LLGTSGLIVFKTEPGGLGFKHGRTRPNPRK